MEESRSDLLVDFGDTEETEILPTNQDSILPDRDEILRTFEAAIASEKVCQVEAQEVSTPQPLDDDIKLISEETFDFTLPRGLMSSSSHEEEEMDDDEEEVFFGPVGHTEKCMATVVGEQEVEPIPALTAADMVHIFKEAHEVAFRISAKFGDKKKDSESEGVLVPSLASPPPAKKHTRKGTFSLDSPEQGEAEPEPTAKPQNSPNKKRKGTFTLESPAKVKPEPEPLSFKRNIPGRRSLPKRSAVNPHSSLKMPLSSKKSLASPATLKTDTTEGNVHRSIPNLKASIIPSNLRRSIQSIPKARNNTDNQVGSVIPSDTKLGGPTKSQIHPLGGLTRPSAGQSGLQRPSASALSRPSSGLKAPSTKRDTAAGPTHSTQSNLKGPCTKLELLKTGNLQKLSLGTNRGKQPSGPMKALGQPSRLKAPSDGQPRIPLKATVNGVPQQGTPTVKPVFSTTKRAISTTPVKQDKKVQPKRLIPPSSTLESDQSPAHNGSLSTTSSTPVHSVKRRSFLPTPGRTFTGPRRSVSSVGAMDPMSSPQLRSKATPLVSRPRIQRTPVNQEKESKVRKSIWSPVRRSKPVSREDEFIQCTKRSRQPHH